MFLTNNFGVPARQLITNYARRNGIEDALGSSVNFFHLDCLSSEVRLNVDLDTVLTVLANGCYRWLASQLLGFDQTKPKALFRKFVEILVPWKSKTSDVSLSTSTDAATIRFFVNAAR